MTVNIKATLQNYRNLINQELENLPIPDFPKSLYEPLQYSLQTKGKRIRPILTLLVGVGMGASIKDLLPAALALEILHTYTLVHDDIMDNDEMRRGQPTMHKKWDINTAILSGDAMNTLAFRVLMNTNSPNLQKIGLEFTKGMMEICEGQALDMEFEGRLEVSLDEYLTMITKKTARLLAMSCKIGGWIADCKKEEVDALENFAIKTGQAFQIQDDLLEILSNSKKMGKSLGSDFASGKKTYPMILTLSEMTPVDKKDFLTFLKNNSNIKEIRNSFLNSGSIEKSQVTINSLLSEAKQELNIFPKELRENLVGLIQYLQKRKS
ncbi:MAG: polyprenyl synthetase family protein [Fidelibacterota bacterium]